MEFKLNKIDTDIRNTINEQTMEGKIHAKQGVEINSEGLKNSNPRDKKEKLKEKKKRPFSVPENTKDKKSIIVNAYKGESVEVDIDKDKETDKGLFIDIRK